MHHSQAAGFFAVGTATAAATGTATATTGPQITELVRIRPNAHDPSWPPVLVFCVVVVALGALFAAIVFLRQAREATRTGGGGLDG